MKKEVEIIIVGSGNTGETIAKELADVGKTAIIVVENEKNQAFEPEPISIHNIRSFDEPLRIIDDLSDKKWYSHFDKFRGGKKSKNKFGRKK